MAENLMDEIFETIDRFAVTVPGFTERIEAGRPLRLALRRMLAAAYDMMFETTDDLIVKWLERQGERASSDDEDVPPAPHGLHGRLDELSDELSQIEAGDLGSEARIRVEAATILFDLGKLDDAISQAMVGRGHFASLGDTLAVAETTMEIGLIQNAFGWRADAIKSYLAAKKVLEENDPNGFLGPLCLNFGNALKDSGKPRDALIQYEVAKRYYEIAGDREGATAAIFNIANTMWALGRFDRAVDGFGKARLRYDSFDLPHKVADCDLAAADVMFHAGHSDAVQLAVAALHRYQALELPVEVAKAELVVAHMADHLGEREYARDLAQSALAFYRTARMWPKVASAAITLAYIESYAGNLEESLAALELARTVSKDNDLTWDAAFDTRMEDQIRTSTLPTHTHPEVDAREPELVDESFVEAVRLAVELHGAQNRKAADGDPPGPSYVGHILGVAAAVIDSGGSRDQAIGGLLHDAVEDSATTVTDLRILFGEEVSSIVDACTDAYEIPKPPWRERKERYVEHLKMADPDALLVTAADKLNNARAMIRDHTAIGNALWDRFNPAADHRWYYSAVLNVVRSRLDNPIVSELEEAVTRLLEILPEDRG